MKHRRVVAHVVICSLALGFVQQAFAAEPTPGHEVPCTYADGQIKVDQEMLEGSTDGLLVTLYDTHGVQVGADFVAERLESPTHTLLYGRLDDVPRAVTAKCYPASITQQPLMMRRCRKATWMHVDEGEDVTIKEAVYKNHSLLLLVAIRYIGMISGLKTTGKIEIVGIEPGEMPVTWYPVSPDEASLLMYVEDIGPEPRFITVGSRDGSMPPFALTDDRAYGGKRVSGLFATSGLCIN